MLDSVHQAIQGQIERVLPEVTQWRHHLHQNPELSYQEEATSQWIAQTLRRLSLDEVREGVGGFGVIGSLRGTAEGAADGPTFALRADMDALPIQEENEIPYRSCRDGVMHACGHDGHMATLLGAAMVLSALRPLLRGTIRFIFQPAEEVAGGAERMCADGAMEGVDAIAALHGWPGLEVGQIGVRSGPMMASADTFDIVIEGRGAHAAMPHSAVDPVVVGAQITLALQTLASREINPIEPVVVTVAQFHAGTAYNVIPGKATLQGTVRCLDPKLRKTMPERLERVVAGICSALRAKYRFTYDFGTPVTNNHPAIVHLIEEVGRELLGPQNVITLEAPSMGAEDFAIYLQHAPGAMFRLGVGKQVTPLHTPTYDFGDAPLPYGIGVFCHLAFRYLQDAPLSAGGL